MSQNFPGIKDEALAASVAELGGKHGVLAHIRNSDEAGVPEELKALLEKHGMADDIPGIETATVPDELRELTMPQVEFGIDEELTTYMREEIKALCEEYETEEIIVRAGDRTDWQGQTGQMLSLGDQFLFSLDDAVEEVRESLLMDPDLVEQARKAGQEFDPKTAHIAVAPFVPPNHFVTVTEHPNMPGVKLVDYNRGILNYASYCVDNGEVHESDDSKFGSIYEGDRPLELSQHHDLLRVPDWFTKDSALQSEWIIIPRGPWKAMIRLVQVRYFVQRQDQADFELPSEGVRLTDMQMYRAFGVTGPEGIELPVDVTNIRGGFRAYERNHQDQPYIHGLHNAHPQDDLKSFYPCHMRGYITHRPGLDHFNTLPVQACLRNNGFAFLNASESEVRYLPEKIRYISSGREACYIAA